MKYITDEWVNKVKEKGFTVSFHGYSSSYTLRDSTGQVLVQEHACFNYQNDRGLLWVENGYLCQTWFGTIDGIHKEFKKVVERLLKMG